MQSRIEFYFFAIVRLLAFLVALVTFAIAIGAGVTGFKYFTSRADTTPHPFTFDYGAFRREEVERDKKKLLGTPGQEEQQKEQAPESPPSSGPQVNEKAVQIDRLRLEIFEQLRTFVRNVDPATPDTAMTFNIERAANDDDVEIDYLANLRNSASSLAKDADFYKHNTFVQDPIHEVFRFLNVFREAYIQYVNDERTRIAAEEQRALEEKAKALQFIYSAAAAFAIFTVWTMILVILRIEINTRNTTDLLRKTTEKA